MHHLYYFATDNADSTVVSTARGVNSSSDTDFAEIAPDSSSPAAGGVGGYAFLVAAQPSSASVAVGGTVASRSGRMLVGARVYLTEQDGTTRTGRTNSFGLFEFTDIPVGTCVITVEAKGYRFTPTTIRVSDWVNDLNLVADP